MGTFVRIWKHSISGEMSDKKENYLFDPVDYVFERDTRVIYYKFTEKVTVKWVGDKEILGKVGFLAPYINENGKYCRFIDNQIVEIV